MPPQQPQPQLTPQPTPPPQDQVLQQVDPELRQRIEADKAAAAAAAQAKKQLPPWAKWVFLGFGIALVLGVAAWAFVTFYLNSPERTTRLILEQALTHQKIAARGLATTTYGDLAMQTDLTLQADGKVASVTYDSGNRLGSNRYDTAGTVVMSNAGAFFQLRNPWQFLYDISGIDAETQQTGGLYDSFATKTDGQWFKLTHTQLAEFSTAPVEITCALATVATSLKNDGERQRLEELFVQYPFVTFVAAGNSTYQVEVNKQQLQAFLSSYATTTTGAKVTACGVPLTKLPLDALDAIQLTATVDPATRNITQLSGSLQGAVSSEFSLSLTYDGAVSDIATPTVEVQTRTIKQELDNIAAWLQIQTQATAPKAKPVETATQ